MNSSSKVPLIADPDSNFLGTLTKQSEGSSSAPLVASGVQQALEILSLKRNFVSVLIVSTAFGKDEVQNTIFAAMRAMPGLPVALITDEDSVRFSDDDLRKLMIQYVLKKPLSYTDLINRLKSLGPEPRLTSKMTDGDFSPMEVGSVAPTASSNEDVYVKLRGDRYVKILKKGFALGSERLERYIRRGIKSFYRAKK